jgi:hypothetical protein
MRTNKQTVVKRNISLSKDEEFTIKPPRGLLTWQINLIEVSAGHFMLYGGPLRGANKGACLLIPHGYCSTDEVPTMPFHVAEEVRRCLAFFAREGGYVTNVNETPASTAPRN